MTTRSAPGPACGTKRTGSTTADRGPRAPALLRAAFRRRVRGHGENRLSRDGSSDPAKLRDRAAAHALILGHARRAGIGPRGRKCDISRASSSCCPGSAAQPASTAKRSTCMPSRSWPQPATTKGSSTCGFMGSWPVSWAGTGSGASRAPWIGGGEDDGVVEERREAVSSLVSVVMSVHDGGEYLAPTMRAVLSQMSTSSSSSSTMVPGTARREILDHYASRIPASGTAPTEPRPHRGADSGLLRSQGRLHRPPDAADLSRPGRFDLQRRALDAARTGIRFVLDGVPRAGDGVPVHRARQRGRPASPPMWSSGGWPADAHGRSHPSRQRDVPEGILRTGGRLPEAVLLAQDRDLWFRLAEVGATSAPESSTSRSSCGQPSSSFRSVQHELGRLARRAFELRREGRPEEEVPGAASALRPRGSARGSARMRAHTTSSARPCGETETRAA